MFGQHSTFPWLQRKAISQGKLINFSINNFSTVRNPLLATQSDAFYLPFTHECLPDETFYILDGTSMLFQGYFR